MLACAHTHNGCESLDAEVRIAECIPGPELAAAAPIDQTAAELAPVPLLPANNAESHHFFPSNED